VVQAKDEALLAAVGCSMAALFLVPSGFFIPATFAATGVMVAAAFASGTFHGRRALHARSVVLGLCSAALLYGVFYGGNLAIRAAAVPGLGASSESSIYSLIASPSNPLALQFGVLFFDAAGYESYFRGTLQKGLARRLGLWAAPAVALADAGLHLLTFNPLWAATTFVADLAWGVTYHYGRGLQASFTSHLLWDVAIFLVRPIL
jgi:CAAX protease family protein